MSRPYIVTLVTVAETITRPWQTKRDASDLSKLSSRSYPRTSTTSFVLSGLSSLGLFYALLWGMFVNLSCLYSVQFSYPQNVEMDRWILTVLGGGAVGKTALLVQVCWLSHPIFSLTLVYYSLLRIISLVSKHAFPYARYYESPSTRLE